MTTALGCAIKKEQKVERGEGEGNKSILHYVANNDALPLNTGCFTFNQHKTIS